MLRLVRWVVRLEGGTGSEEGGRVAGLEIVGGGGGVGGMGVLRKGGVGFGVSVGVGLGQGRVFGGFEAVEDLEVWGEGDGGLLCGSRHGCVVGRIRF